MNRLVQLVCTDAVALRRFDHVPGVPHQDAERERATQFGVNFVEAGSFRLRTRGAWETLASGALFVTTPGMEFSCAHDEEHPSDTCLSIGYSEQAVESARSAVTLGAAPARPLTNRLAFLRRSLRACVAGDEARTEALAGEVLWALSAGTDRHALFRPERFAWYAARVDRVKAMIEERYADPLSLSVMARDAGMSVFHFARIFAELEGQPPYRFLTDVRLEHARVRIGQGAGITDTCFAVGFGSLSHFVTTFRRRYGMRPSEVRRPSASF